MSKKIVYFFFLVYSFNTSAQELIKDSIPFGVQIIHESPVKLQDGAGTAVWDGLRKEMRQRKTSLEERSKQLEADGQYEKMLYYTQQIDRVEDSLFMLVEAQSYVGSARYEHASPLLADDLLRADNARATVLFRQSKMFDFMINGFMGAVLILGLLCYLFKIQKDKNQQISEMKIQIEKKNELLKERKEQIEILNEELSHRVKNNLMFVSSLMRLQARRLKHPEAKAAIKEAEHRVEAMAMVHRKLYEQEGTTMIEMHEYLNQLGDSLLRSYAAIDSVPIIKFNFENLTLESDDAVQIGLIVNELMTNSFKHGFENHCHPAIVIKMIKKEDHAIQLIYSDNGVGIPFDFNLERSSSLGLRLIHDLTEQLNGTVEISNQDGAHFQFEFMDIRITG